MNIIAQKKEIIQRINEEQDEFVIHAIKEMLDANKISQDPVLNQQLNLAIMEADNGDMQPYEVVSAEFRKKYHS